MRTSGLGLQEEVLLSPFLLMWLQLLETGHTVAHRFQERSGLWDFSDGALSFLSTHIMNS